MGSDSPGHIGASTPGSESFKCSNGSPPVSNTSCCSSAFQASRTPAGKGRVAYRAWIGKVKGTEVVLCTFDKDPGPG